MSKRVSGQVSYLCELFSRNGYYLLLSNIYRLFNLKGDQECYIEIENLDEPRPNDANHHGSSQSSMGQKTAKHDDDDECFINIFNYTGILYTQRDKKMVNFKLKDFYSNTNSILISAVMPS